MSSGDAILSGDQPTSNSPAENDDTDARGFSFNEFSNLTPSVNSFQDGDERFTTATERDASAYNLSEGKRLALVFNHSHFRHDNYPKRPGTETDCQAIKETFENHLGFEVSICKKRVFQTSRITQAQRFKLLES